MNNVKNPVKFVAITLTWAAFPAALCAGEKDNPDKIPLYLWARPSPFQTVEAERDDAYHPGDIAVVAGRWQRGGLAGGAILLCSVDEPEVSERNVLAAEPFHVRYFYLDVLPAEAAAEKPGGFARARGLVAADDLYAYAYVLRPDKLEPLAQPTLDEEEVRGTLAALRKDIKKIKLDLISSDVHRPYNKKYKIVADAAAAELELEAADYERNLAVVLARLERLPPEDSDVLFRYLDVYVVTDLETGEARWAVACTGGYYLE